MYVSLSLSIFMYMSLWFLHAPVHLCCDLYRSPSWPVWAPRIPNTSQNLSTQPIICRFNTNVEPSHPSSSPYMVSRTRFWSSTSSPLSSHSASVDVKDAMTTGVITPIAKNVYPIGKQQSFCAIGNGFLNDNNSRLNDRCNNENTDASITSGIFRVPLDVPRHARKNYDRNSFEARNERNAVISSIGNESNGQQSSVFPIAKPRISAAGWRGMSKTCDCIEKGKTSPVLRLVDQARAVSSPDPLHRPDNQRAPLRSATTAQVHR